MRAPLTRQESENPVPHFPWAAAAKEKRHIDSHYPTQAKGRLEWGTQHFLPMWQILWFTRWTHFRMSGLKALIAVAWYGTAKPVPFVKRFFRSL